MDNCPFYMGDSGHHLYIHCPYKGLVTAKQWLNTERK